MSHRLPARRRPLPTPSVRSQPQLPRAVSRAAVRAPSVAGHLAESRACAWLASRGYRILGRNLRYRVGELDIVADDRGVLCFIEVRQRRWSRYGTAVESVTARKRQRLARAASAYLQGIPTPWPPCRFDVVSISGEARDGTLELWRAAFEVTR